MKKLIRRDSLSILETNDERLKGFMTYGMPSVRRTYFIRILFNVETVSNFVLQIKAPILSLGN